MPKGDNYFEWNFLDDFFYETHRGVQEAPDIASVESLGVWILKFKN